MASTWMSGHCPWFCKVPWPRSRMSSAHVRNNRFTGVIDAAVQGGINKYREAFFGGCKTRSVRCVSALTTCCSWRLLHPEIPASRSLHLQVQGSFGSTASPATEGEVLRPALSHSLTHSHRDCKCLVTSVVHRYNRCTSTCQSGLLRWSRIWRVFSLNLFHVGE